MFPLSYFKDSPEFLKRKQTPFRPPTTVTLKQIHEVVPKELFRRNLFVSLLYILRAIFFVSLFYWLSTFIEPITNSELVSSFGYWPQQTIRWSMWATYWIWQSLGFSGLWTLSHEAGHNSLSDYPNINNLLGFTMHTFLLVPYFSWRATHHAHHKATGSMERDENYVPRTRVDYKLPPEKVATTWDYKEAFEETPIVTLGRIAVMQLLGWQMYVLWNALGSPSYPPWTNHFDPNSPLFKPDQRRSIIATDLGLCIMASLLYMWTQQNSLFTFINVYGVPWLLLNHWIVMLTYLHHTDPTQPHYRKPLWSFTLGAIGTVDRHFLGWAGIVFFHNVSHDHVAHHFFSQIPFYNIKKVTERIKPVLGDWYNYDSTGIWRALYRSFTQCIFVEQEGDVIFYKNRKGEVGREIDAGWIEEWEAKKRMKEVAAKEEVVGVEVK